MPSMTLLEMVQDILSDMDSDEVDTILETVESAQVAQTIKTTYFNIIDGREWPHLKQLIQPVQSGDILFPTHMTIGTTSIELEYVKYNKKRVGDAFDKFEDIKYLPPKEFMDVLAQRHSNATNVVVVTDPTGVSLNIITDAPPTYYTSFDNDKIVFDSFDIAVDTLYMLTTKVQAYGRVYPTWTASDGFVPDLPIQAFSYLLNEAKSAAFIVLKQSPNPTSDRFSVTQRRRMSQDAWKVNNGITFPDYGRKK